MTVQQLLPALVVGLAACSGRDPILDRADALDATPQGAAGTHAKADAAPPTRGTPAPPTPVAPPEPAPADAGTPEPVQPGTPQPGKAEPPPPPGASEGVLLAGTVVLNDHKGGPIRVDVFDGDQRAASGGGKRPSVVAMARLDAPGRFEVRIPAGTDRVWLGAFADEDKDGRPGPLDPEVWFGGNPVTVGAGTDDLTLVLQRRAPPPGG